MSSEQIVQATINDESSTGVEQPSQPAVHSGKQGSRQGESRSSGSRAIVNESGDQLPLPANLTAASGRPSTKRSSQASKKDDLQIEPIVSSRSSSRAENDEETADAEQRSFRRQLEEDELKYGATHVIKLFVPVSLCMLMVIASVRSLPFYTQTNVYLPYTPYTDQTVDTTTRVWQSFANAFIVLTVVACMTVVLIVFYKLRCYRLIHGWLLMSSSMLMLMFVTGYTTGTRLVRPSIVLPPD
jgi:hypothetical protein